MSVALSSVVTERRHARAVALGVELGFELADAS
jgi:hypothetical protein